jgi:O-antigen biosynthesis protein
MESFVRYWQKAKQIWQKEGGFVMIYKFIRKCKRKFWKEVSKLWQFNIRKWKKHKAIDSTSRNAQNFGGGNSITFPWYAQPQISIIIYAENYPDFTHKCLVQIATWIDKTSWEIEVILIEDGATNSELYALISGLWILKNSVKNYQKLGFFASIQRASTKARGKWLLALRQDILLTQTAFERTIDRFQKQPTGILFPKIFYPQRELMSAGGTIWQDGDLSSFGEHDFSKEPEYNYLRSLDFGLPIAFTIETSVWHSYGHYPENHSSDYAIADLCLSLKHQHNLKILYDPKVEMECQYGYPKAMIQSPPPEFLLKWQNLLSSQPTKTVGLLPRRDRPTILIIDTLVPAYDKESGSLRLFQIMRILLDLGYDLIFLPHEGHEQEPYTTVLEELGIEVLYFSYKQTDWLDRLIRRLSLIQIAWVCRPELCERYFPILKQNPEIKIIYDTIDLHFLRLKRGWEMDPDREPEWQKMQQLEFQMAQKADLTLVVTEVEKEILIDAQAHEVKVIPNIHQIYTQPIPSFSDRSNLLFIGGYYHKPNVDAVLWLCNQIMPLIWQIQPEIKLTLLGSNPSPEVLSLESDRVTVPGYIANVESYFLNHRVFIAPLRYGAGMKGKIGQSLSYGLPTITTTIGAEGMGLSDRQNVLIANSGTEIAKAVLNLYENTELWQSLSQASFEVIRPFTYDAVKARIHRMLKFL